MDTILACAPNAIKMLCPGAYSRSTDRALFDLDSSNDAYGYSLSGRDTLERHSQTQDGFAGRLRMAGSATVKSAQQESIENQREKSDPRLGSAAPRRCDMERGPQHADKDYWLR